MQNKRNVKKELNELLELAEKGDVQALNERLELAKKGDVKTQIAASLYFMGIDEFRKSAVMLKEPADQGDPLAQFLLAKAYYNGHGVKKNYKKAVGLYTRSAEGGHDLSQYELGYSYIEGFGVEKNEKTGMDWIHKAANNGLKKAQHFLVGYHQDLVRQNKNREKNQNEIMKWGLMAAEQGCVESQIAISENYYLGTDGVKKNIRLAKKWAKKLAKQGNARGQAILGLIIRSSDPEQGFNLLKKSSEQGDETAIYNLATCYFDGIGTEKSYEEGLKLLKTLSEKSFENMWEVGDFLQHYNKKEALKFYIRAGNQGGPEFQMRVGKLYDEGTVVEKDLKKENEWLEKAAKSNHPLAQARLGAKLIFKEIDYEVPKKNSKREEEIKEALDWLKKSSKNGSSDGMFVLGIVLANGEPWGIKENNEEALKWFQRASDKGYTPAQIQMAYLMHDGIAETPGSKSEGFRLLSFWAEKGHKGAQIRIAEDYATGYSGVTEKNPEKAFFWAKKAAKEEDPAQTGETDPFVNDARFLLGRCYDLGWGVKKNHKLAFKYQLLAAEQGHIMAQNTVGMKYRRGVGVKKDLKKSFIWTKESARKFPEGELNLGVYYLYGIGTDMSYEKAYEYIKKAADKGLPLAQVRLAGLYKKGRGVKKNTIKALHWLKQASEENQLGANLKLAYLFREEKKKMKGYLSKEVEIFFSSSNVFEMPKDLENHIDEEEAIWMGELTQQGEALAITYAGQTDLYNSKLKDAFKLFKTAASQNDIVAKFYLAEFYRYGRVVSKNVLKAKTLLNEVKDAINSSPLKNLEMAKTAMDQDQLSHFAGKFFKENKDLEIYEDRVRYESDITYEWSFLMSLEKQAQEIISSIEVLHEKEKTQKEVLSYLTHTINSAFGATQENLNQTIKILKNEYEKGTPQYKAINNIVSLASTFSVINNLVQTFKIYINEPRVFKDAWAKDNGGDGNQIKVLAFSVRLVIAYILFQLPPYKVNGLARSKNDFNLKVLRKDFINEILLLELNDVNSYKIVQWVEKNFNFSFKLGENELFHFEQYGIRFNFLLSIATEIILNSVKYSKPNLPIEIFWEYNLRQFVFKCSNFIDIDSEGKFLGAGRGLDFIKELVRNLGNSNLRVTNKANEKFETILKIKNI